MNNCAVICEYNPFHSGHKYQLDVIRPIYDNVICVMSGQFVQSAMPAFCDKALRAECALAGGADAVIELPALYATASAQYFAEGALKIISGIKGINALAMGAVACADDIFRIAEIKINCEGEFTALLKDGLAAGLSYNKASAKALCKLYCNKYPAGQPEKVFDDANAILCIEYICAISKFSPNISPRIIVRKGAGHNDDILNADYISATAIRRAEENGKLCDVERFIPFNLDKIVEARRLRSPDLHLYNKMAVYAIKRATIDELKRLRSCSEGLEHLLKNMSAYSDVNSYIDGAECRRYGKKRIYRMFFDCLVGIKKEHLTMPFVTRLLACKHGFNFSVLPSCVKTNNADIKSAAKDENIRETLAIDERATALYNTLCSVYGDYYNYSLVKI